MKKILVIFTGGTIGSQIKDATIDVDAAAGGEILKMFHEKYVRNIEFETMQPLNILSENSNPMYWQVLYNAMKNLNFQSYSGIIITHGSDTLPYTGAFIGFLFHYLEIPIVITASNYTLGRAKSNGLTNFINSVELIHESGLKGIYSVFQNNKNKSKIFLSTRIQEADAYQDQFISFGGSDLGEIQNGKVLLHRSAVNPTRKQLNEHRVKLLGDDLYFVNRITAIKPYPGLVYRDFNFPVKPSAILHSLYHSGTGCIHGGRYSLPDFVKKCIESGIDFYIISLKNVESDLYITSREIMEAGAIPLQNISFEAAYAKLNIAYNQTAMSPMEYMQKEIFFEFLPKMNAK